MQHWERMASSSRGAVTPRHGKPASTLFLAMAGAVILMLLSGCGSGSSSTSGSRTNCPSASTVASWHLVQSGKLNFAVDTTYAPAEYPDPTNPTNFIGYDIDIAKELGNRLCLTTVIDKASFDSIISTLSGPPLGQQPYDLSISSFTINPARQKVVDMIPYFQAGESLLIPVGNPGHLTSNFASMCGKPIAVQDGTVEQGEIEDANGTGNGQSGQAPVCKNNKIKELHFTDQTTVVQQVINGNAVGSYQDSPVTGYYASLNSSALVAGPVTVAPSPEGIVMRKDNPALETAIKNALAAMRSDGTYKKILQHWGQLNGAYPPLS